MRFLRPLLGLLILVGTVGAGPPAPPGAADAARTRQDPIFPDLGELGLDVRHYDVGLTVDRPGTPELRGVVTLTLGSTRPLGQVQLDFLGPHVTATRWNGQDVPFRVDGAAGKLTVTPPAPLVPGQTARLTVEYRGTPGTVLDPGFSTPLRLGWQTVPPVGNRAGANFTLSEPHGTHTFLPCNDHPSDKATFTTRVTVHAGFTAAASGVEGPVREQDGGRTFSSSRRRSPSPRTRWAST